jgi:hypothetical protein
LINIKFQKGFGDFVPGQKEGDPYAGPKLILGAIYVLIGMAILAMCFDLMQEEIIAKFTWLGKKLGIVDKEEEDDIDENNNENADKFEKAKDTRLANGKDEKKEKPIYISPERERNVNSQSPSPSLRGSALNEDGNLSRQFRSAYLQNVVQRQQVKP